MQEDNKSMREGEGAGGAGGKASTGNGVIKRIFITGLVALLPLVVTIYILKFLYGLIVSNLMPFFIKVVGYYNVKVPEPLMGLLTVIMFLLITFLMGLLTRLYVGRFLLNILEKTITAIPLANTIYNAMKQMIDSFKSSNNNFQKVVLVNFPSDNAYCLGFLVKDSQPIISSTLGMPTCNVFVPTTPNPTSGFITIFPVDKCIELNVTVEEGIKFIFSVGVINFSSGEEAKARIKNLSNK